MGRYFRIHVKTNIDKLQLQSYVIYRKFKDVLTLYDSLAGQCPEGMFNLFGVLSRLFPSFPVFSRLFPSFPVFFCLFSLLNLLQPLYQYSDLILLI